MDIIEINGNEYEVTGRASDGLPIIRGYTTSTQDGFDVAGNPKVSVNINVPPIQVGVIPGDIN